MSNDFLKYTSTDSYYIYKYTNANSEGHVHIYFKV